MAKTKCAVRTMTEDNVKFEMETDQLITTIVDQVGNELRAICEQMASGVMSLESITEMFEFCTRCPREASLEAMLKKSNQLDVLFEETTLRIGQEMDRIEADILADSKSRKEYYTRNRGSIHEQ